MFWTVLIAAIEIAGIITAIRAIMDVRTPQGTIAWVMVLVTVPFVSVPAYWIFGRSKFQGYVSKRRTTMLETSAVAQRFARHLEQRHLLAHPGREHAQLIDALAKLPFTVGNDVELLVDGEATYRSIFEGIAAAKHYVLVEFYILRDDETGRELQEHLIAKAREGVQVRVLFDEIGSSHLPASYQSKLTNAGVRIHPFNTRKGRANRWQLNFRNHRKIVVVDGLAAWVGGLNVGDEYRGRDPKIGAWRDTHLKVTGPVVTGVQLVFYEDWHWAARRLLDDLRWEAEPASSGANRAVLCLPSGPADPLETCTLFFLQVIHRAQTRLWIASPYFVPDEQFISALQLAALRGVDVRILVPSRSDNHLVELSAWSYVADLEKTGVRVFQHREGFMHQKVLLVDDHYATTGTANFDNRSFRLNFEITMAVADEAFAAQVRKMLEGDFTGARLITAMDLNARGFWFRMSTRIARLMAPVQ